MNVLILRHLHWRSNAKLFLKILATQIFHQKKSRHWTTSQIYIMSKTSPIYKHVTEKFYFSNLNTQINSTLTDYWHFQTLTTMYRQTRQHVSNVEQIHCHTFNWKQATRCSENVINHAKPKQQSLQLTQFKSMWNNLEYCTLINTTHNLQKNFSIIFS